MSTYASPCRKHTRWLDRFGRVGRRLHWWTHYWDLWLGAPRHIRPNLRYVAPPCRISQATVEYVRRLAVERGWVV